MPRPMPREPPVISACLAVIVMVVVSSYGEGAAAHPPCTCSIALPGVASLQGALNPTSISPQCGPPAPAQWLAPLRQAETAQQVTAAIGRDRLREPWLDGRSRTIACWSRWA